MFLHNLEEDCSIPYDSLPEQLRGCVAVHSRGAVRGHWYPYSYPYPQPSEESGDDPRTRIDSFRFLLLHVSPQPRSTREQGEEAESIRICSEQTRPVVLPAELGDLCRLFFRRGRPERAQRGRQVRSGLLSPGPGRAGHTAESPVRAPYLGRSASTDPSGAPGSCLRSRRRRTALGLVTSFYLVFAKLNGYLSCVRRAHPV